MLRNMLGPIFNLYLDHINFVVFCFFCWGGGAETPIFIVLFSKNCKNLKKDKK